MSKNAGGEGYLFTASGGSVRHNLQTGKRWEGTNSIDVMDQRFLPALHISL